MSEDRSERLWDLVVVGAGPAGLSCAIYAGRGRVATLILEKMLPGGQVVLNHFIENYPGFGDGIEGLKLAQEMSRQAERFGARTEIAEASGLAASRRPLRIYTSAGERAARAALIATGCSPRKLRARGEAEFAGRGVSYCATCDGPLFSGKRLVVVGGGNSALEEAIFLTNFASKVTVVHRRDQLRADQILQENASANERIELLLSHEVTEIVGGESVRGVRARQVNSGSATEVIARDEAGFVITGPDCETSVEGVFAAGDVCSGSYRQISCAVGDGARAYRSIARYLEHDT